MELFTNFFRLDLFSHLGEWIVSFTLVLIRVLAFLHVAPIFSHKSFTSMHRIGLGLLLTLIITDTAIMKAAPEAGYSLPFVAMINLALGMLMGYVVRVMFSIVNAAGEMMDSSMGFSSAQMFDPQMGSQTTIIGSFMSNLSIVVFFAVSGPETLIKGLFNSVSTFSIYSSSITISINKIIALTGDVITMGFLIASPMVLTILITDLVLGLISRASPQINAFQISFTIKPSIGLIIFLLILPLFFSSLSNLFTSPSRLF